MRRVAYLVAALTAVVVAAGYAPGWPWTFQASASVLPTEAAQQVEWLGDFYAAGLEYYYGRYGLSPQAMEATRVDLAHRLAGVVLAPLDGRQLSELSEWLFRSCAWIGALDIPPPALQLRESAGNLAHMIALYLSRPRLTREQQDQIAGQLGIMLDVLRAAMLKEFAEMPGVEALVREAIYARAADFGRLIKDPVALVIKRAHTPEEIEQLCAYARQLRVGKYVAYAETQRNGRPVPRLRRAADCLRRLPDGHHGDRGPSG
jgi:hypothetical protein